MSKLDELTTELTTHLKAARDVAAAAETENRDFTDEERTVVDEHLAKAKPLRDQINKLKGDKELMAAIADLGDGIGLVVPGEKTSPKDYRRSNRKTLGQEFIDSPEFKSFLGQFPEGRIPEKARIQSMPVGFKTLITGASSTSAGVFTVADFDPTIEPLGRRELTIRDLISVRQTESDQVTFVRQTTRVNAAATVAEATATSGTSGTKPEGGFAFETVTESVKTIAEWIPATRRALSDASQLRGLIDQELREDLAEEEEDQVLNGDGTGENVTGILNTSGTQSQAWDTDILTTTRKARTKVRTVGRSTPTAYVLHPLDWEKIDLLQDNEARYFFGGPANPGQPRLWGLPVVESEAMPEGTGVVADWRKAVLWDREQASITVSDSHSDFFIRNMIAILGEERIAFGVRRPTAFVEIDLTA